METNTNFTAASLADIHPHRHMLNPSDNVLEMHHLSISSTDLGDLPLHSPTISIPSLNIPYDENYDIETKFITLLTSKLFSFGLPAHRLETVLSSLQPYLTTKYKIGAFPNGFIVTCLHPITNIPYTIIDRTLSGFDMGGLYKLDTMLYELKSRKIGVSEALEIMEKVNGGAGWNQWVVVLAFGVASFAGAPLAFDGSWMDALFSFILGLLVGYLNIISAPSPFSLLFEFISAVFVSFIAVLIQTYIYPNICFAAVTLSALLVPLPGLILCMSFVELASKQFISGSSRLWHSLLIALLLAFGLSLGARLSRNLFSIPLNQPVTCSSSSISPLFNILFLPLISFSLVILLNATYRQYPIMIFNNILSFWLFYIFIKYTQLGTELTAFITSFITCTIAEVYEHVTKFNGVPATLMGVIILVPGSIATKTLFTILGNDVVNVTDGASGFAVLVISIALSISMGLLLSRAVCAWVFDKIDILKKRASD